MTIFEAIKSLTSTDVLTSSLGTLIQSKLITLFNQLCHVNLTLDTANFSYFLNRSDGLHVKFEYAEIVIYYSENNIAIKFYLKNHEKIETIPAGSQMLIVIADHDMNHQSATFKSVFSLIGHQARGTLQINRRIDIKLNMTTQFSYANSSKGFDMERFDLQHENLPKAYLQNENNFYIPFLKMIECCFNSPEIFYSIFDDYPSHKNMLSYAYEFKNFLRLYNNQYKSGKKALKSRLLLLDMQAI